MVNNTAKKLLNAVGAEVLVTTQEDLRFYLTGFQSSFGVVVTDEYSTRFYTDARYFEAATVALAGRDIRVMEYPRGEKLVELLRGYNSLGMPLDRLMQRNIPNFCKADIKLSTVQMRLKVQWR